MRYPIRLDDPWSKEKWMGPYRDNKWGTIYSEKHNHCWYCKYMQMPIIDLPKDLNKSRRCQLFIIDNIYQNTIINETDEITIADKCPSYKYYKDLP